MKMGYLIQYQRSLISTSILLVLLLSLFAQPSFAGFKYSYAGCGDVTDADFKATVLFSHATNPATSQPLKMAFDMDATGNTDVYFVQREGMLRRYNGLAKSLTELGTVPVTTPSSDGLNGIALDPGFKANRWVYLFYTVSDQKLWRISRFTIKADKLDLTSEKIILVIPTKGSSQHPGGGMAFDREGNLWFGSGENSMITGGGAPASSTNDLRGKILRIKPKPIPDETILTGNGVGVTYDIPEGNLFKPGIDKTLPEIYVMGVRNPYSLTLDPVRKAVTWGDIGPDGNPNPTEEHDFTTKPMNGGWPFFSGNNTNLGGGGTAALPTNTLKGNTGLIDLPPVTPGLHTYMEDCAITGPVYYYNSNPKLRGRLPPHFDGKWFVTDYNKSWVHILTLDEKGEKILREDTAFAGILNKNIFKNPLDFQAGPDGALYLVSYAGTRTDSVTDQTGIVKIEYTSDCAPVAITVPQSRLQMELLGLVIVESEITLTRPGLHSLLVRTPKGRIVSRLEGKGPAHYALKQSLRPGLYIVNIRAEQGEMSVRVIIE
jgi:cytochrome c